MIGIFWIYEKKIFYKLQSLDEVEAINNLKDSNLSHYEIWEEIKNSHPKFYLYEYEDIPRGRVVFDIKNNKFIVYSNKDIISSKIAKNLIIKNFDLNNKKVEFKIDEHYTILTSNRL